MKEDQILKILHLICKILIYRLPVHDSIDRTRKEKFEKELQDIQKNKGEI